MGQQVGVLPCVGLKRSSGLGESSNERNGEVKRHTGQQRGSVKYRVHEDLGDCGLNVAASHHIFLCANFVRGGEVINGSTYSVSPTWIQLTWLLSASR